MTNMSSEILYSILLGILYAFFINKMAKVVLSSQNHESLFQNTILIMVLSAVLAFIMAHTIFTKNKKFNNKVIKNGLIIGSILLVAYPPLMCWNQILDETKLLIIGVCISVIIWYTKDLTSAK